MPTLKKTVKMTVSCNIAHTPSHTTLTYHTSSQTIHRSHTCIPPVESPQESPTDSPVPPTKILEEDESSFVKTYFESLEKALDPQLLQVPSPRQSISAKFLEKSLG